MPLEEIGLAAGLSPVTRPALLADPELLEGHEAWMIFIDLTPFGVRPTLHPAFVIEELLNHAWIVSISPKADLPKFEWAGQGYLATPVGEQRTMRRHVCFLYCVEVI
jgi:hypothetical protein